MLQQKDLLRKSGPLTTRVINLATGEEVFSSSSYSYYPCVGSYSDIESVRTGRFVPNEFRVNPVSIRKTVGVDTGGLVTAMMNGTQQVQFIGPLESFYYHPSFSFPTTHVNSVDLSIVKTWGKLNEVIWDLGTFLAELRQTLHMLRNPIENLHKYTERRIKADRFKPSWRSGVPYVHFVVDNWLTYRYGWRPLIKDLQDAIAAVLKKFDAASVQLRSRRSKILYENSSSAIINGSVGGLHWTCLEKTKTTYETTCVLYYIQRVMDLNDKLARLIGWDLANIPSVAWEIVRYSFVVDWFYGVGKWLAAIKPNPSIDYRGGCVSQIERVEYTREGMGSVYYNDPTKVGTVVESPRYTWTTQSLTRTVGPTVPLLPAYNPNTLGLLKELDSLALLWKPLLSMLLSGNKGRRIKGLRI